MHIKMMWGLYQPNNVPPIPDAVILKDFYLRFSNPEQVETVVENAASPDVIPLEMVMSMKEVRAGGGKIANNLGHIDQIYILYCQGILAKTGIRAWCPDLNDAPDSLYNSACRITALKCFRELLSSGAYNYMNPSPQYINALPLFIRMYNHYVHFLMKEKFNKELKAAGKVAELNNRRVVQKNRERVSGYCFSYGIWLVLWFGSLSY